MIKGIIFDVDGVLLDSFESNLEFFQELMKAAGYPAPTAEQYLPLFHLKLRNVLEKLLEPTNEAEVERLYQLAQHGNFRTKPGILPDGAKETIKNLSDNYSLGVVTSRLRRFVYEPPMDILQKYFEVTVSEEDTQKHKPNPEPLLLAAKHLKLSPEQCAYIGDVENDLIAARAAGMKFILFSKEKVDGADIQTTNFREIPGLILGLK